MDNHLLDIPDPRTLTAGGGAWADFERVFFTGASSRPPSDDGRMPY